MQDGTWTSAVSELLGSARLAFVRFWKEDIVQVALASGMFLALALPLVIVILLLWWLDSTGWRPTGGSYKIGQGLEIPASQAIWLLAFARSDRSGVRGRLDGVATDGAKSAK